MKKAVIFDMDGVIFDSERVLLEDWIEMGKKYHLENIGETFLKCVGRNAAAAKDVFLETYGPDFPYDTLKEEHRAHYREKYSGGRLPMKPGAREVLQDLKAKGYSIALGSSTRSVLVKQQLQDAGLIQYFDVIVGGDMVERSKPHPDVFLLCAKGLEAEPSQIYVIEDSINGIKAACNGGMIPIMVPDLIPPTEEMHQKAKVILKDLFEVMEYLK